MASIKLDQNSLSACDDEQAEFDIVIEDDGVEVDLVLTVKYVTVEEYGVVHGFGGYVSPREISTVHKTIEDISFEIYEDGVESSNKHRWFLIWAFKELLIEMIEDELNASK